MSAKKPHMKVRLELASTAGGSWTRCCLLTNNGFVCIFFFNGRGYKKKKYEKNAIFSPIYIFFITRFIYSLCSTLHTVHLWRSTPLLSFLNEGAVFYYSNPHNPLGSHHPLDRWIRPGDMFQLFPSSGALRDLA